MYRRFRKTAAAVMAAVLMLQGGSFAAAAAEPQQVTETQTQPAAEPQTQEQTQPATEAQTQEQTQPATEPQTQPATQPATEAQTQSETQPATEAQTQSETQTQTSQTQSETQEQTASSSGQTEENTEENTEKKNKKNKKQKETEPSERKNDGTKMSSSKLASGLGNALRYLFAANTVNGPETLLESQEFASGETGASIISSLKSFSVELANARSASDVEIINVYADENGKLDEKQLKDKFENGVIDVTKKYCVINVIAASPGQALSFSGYDMVLSGTPVVYDDEADTGDVLYNFAALDGEDFVGYTGTLTLTGQPGLQGTYLAPEADVQVQSDLAGAVYADTVTVADQVTDLLNIAFLVQRTAAEEPENTTEEQTEDGTEAQSEDGTEAQTEDGTEDQSENVTESQTEDGTEAQTEDATEPQTEDGTEVQTEDVTKEQTEAVTEDATETQTEDGTEEQTEAVTEAQTEDMTKVQSESGTEAQTESQSPGESESGGAADEDGSDGQLYEEQITDTADAVLDMAAYLSGGVSVYYSAETTEVNFRLSFENSSSAASSGKIAVRTAVDILNQDGTLRTAKDTLVVPATDAASAPASVSLQKGAVYYLELSEIPDGYSAVPRIYVMAGTDGTVTFSPENIVQLTDGTATITLSENSNQQNGTAVLSVMRGDGKGASSGTAVTDAAFVVKNSAGEIVKDTDGNPYYIHYTGSQVVLSGLAAGSYTLSQLRTDAGYKIAGDINFEIKSDAQTIIESATNLETILNEPVASDEASVSVLAQARFNDVVLTADEGVRQEYYLAVFADREGKTRTSGVASAVFTPGQQQSSQVTFSGYESQSGGTYYIIAVDEFGQALKTDDQSGLKFAPLLISGAGVSVPAVFPFDFGNKESDFPTGSFYYMAPVRMTKRVLNGDGSDRATTETFYAKLFSDAAMTQPAADFTFAMGGGSSVSAKAQVKMTSARAVFYPAETNQDGTVTDASAADFPYVITCPASVEIVCQKDASSEAAAATEITIVNQVNADASVVSVRLTDEKGALFADKSIQWVIKGTDGKIVSVNNKTVFQKSEMLLKGLTPGQTYLLSEVSAPSGYAPAADVEFTVAEGVMTSVAMAHETAKTTNHSISVQKQVYVGSHQVYAQDASDGRYAKAGRYTFYAALFSDPARTKKVSNVQKITVSGFGGTTAFQNLKGNTTYYLAETNQYGEPLASTDSCTIQYSGGGEVKTSSGAQNAVITNVYSKLQSGYRYTALLTLKKQVTDAAGTAVNVNESFYIGIFRKSDYSDKPTIVRLDLKNASSAGAKRRILLSGNSDITYYIAEVDAQGKRLAGSADFPYDSSVDSPQVKLTKSDSKTVTVTNRQKAAEDSKVTLYLTKRVYSGAQQIAVNDTFYAGLFKDEKFTQLYTNPIPLTLENKSELTLKLSLNLGSASGAKIYVAETDEKGNVIKDEESFGYEIRLINSTAEFTKDRKEVQTVLMNSVYGTSTQDDWDQIFASDGNDFGDYGSITGNGEASASTSSPQTGDDTPIMWYIGLMAASFVLLAAGYRRRRLHSKE